MLQFVENPDLLELKAGVGWQPGLVGEAKVGIDRDSQAGYTLTVNETVIVTDLDTETRFSGPPLLRQHKVRSGMSVVIAGTGRQAFGVLGVHVPHLRQFNEADANFLQAVANVISARWRQECADRNQAALMREMSHRVANMMQVADSIFRQTVKPFADLEAARQAYSARLYAMSRSCAVIARGGLGDVKMDDLVTEALAPFGDLIAASGPDAEIGSDLAFDLGLIWHELATNSAKYGALKTHQGQVRLSWDVTGDGENRTLTLVWRDTSPVCAEATGTGFGSRLMTQLVEQKHGGTLAVSGEGGYCCEISLPF